MSKYEVKDVVCDYGVYQDGELKLILNSRRIAEQIVSLLKEDEQKHRELNPVKDYPSYLDRPKMTDKKKRKYFRKCGECGERHEQSEMIRTDQSDNGWLCAECYEELNPCIDTEWA